MYKILIIENEIQNIINKNNVKFLKLNDLSKELRNAEYELIYLKKEYLTEIIEKDMLSSNYMKLPKMLRKIAINNEIDNTYVSIEIINKLIMDNIKIIEFKNYCEEMTIANIIKKKMQELDKAKNIGNTVNFYKNREKRLVNKVVKRDYAANSIVRKVKYILYRKNIKQKFFENILNNIKNDIKKLGDLNAMDSQYESEKVKVLIADDNKGFCDLLIKAVLKCDDIEIVGTAYTDEDEIKLIENLKPDIVITDLLRNHRYSGLDIIKSYMKKQNKPLFLVISADKKEDVIDSELEIAGYIQKPCFDDAIIQELRNIINNKIK